MRSAIHATDYYIHRRGKKKVAWKNSSEIPLAFCYDIIMIIYMHRTTLMLPESVRADIEREARKAGVSFGEMVRRVLEKYLLAIRGKAIHDPFFSSQTVFQDDGPTDVATDHDRALTDRGPH